MSEVKRSEIIYEEGWRDAVPAAEESTPVDEEKPSEEPVREKEGQSKPLLIAIQLALCLITALVLFLMKTMDSPSYRSFMSFFHDELKKPLISQEIFGAADISRLFTDTAVKVEATPDETADSGD